MLNPAKSMSARGLGALRKLYREFESLSLRHAVWDAEKLGGILLEIARNRRNSAILPLKPDQRKCPAGRYSQVLPPFSLEGAWAVRFQRLHKANAMRSQTDDPAKARCCLPRKAKPPREPRRRYVMAGPRAPRGGEAEALQHSESNGPSFYGNRRDGCSIAMEPFGSCWLQS